MPHRSSSTGTTATDDARTASGAFTPADASVDAPASAPHGRSDDLPGEDDDPGADAIGQMLSDLARSLRSNPWPALAVAAAVGFLLGRMLHRDQ